MANTLGVYNPIFYAQEALIQLEKALGMASRVYLGYDEERRSFRRGETINIRKPSTFTAQDAPSTAQDLDTETVALTLSYWREVKFKLTDKELTFTGERIINDHIRPAAYALADDIDLKLNLEYKNIPWFHDVGATPGVSDITSTKQVLFDNNVPMAPGMIHFEIDGTLQNSFEQLAAFSQWQGAGPDGVSTQRTGSLGTKFGAEIFANQNVQDHTSGVCADSTGAIDFLAGYSKGATTIHVDGMTQNGTWTTGDSFVIAGNTQRYVVTADVVFVGVEGEADIDIFPALVQDHSDNDVVTGSVDNHTANLMFHRNTFALAMAPLSEMGNELGANIASVQDPVTGLALRSRLYYVGNSSEVHVALDVLYGVKTLDPNLACRARN